MSVEKRPYRMQRRAELEAETRRRITESAATLHGTLGPSRTTVSAIAEHAGVRRSTVYRHFADEAALFEACSTHWMQQNPPPDLAAWAAIRDPDARLAAALSELYAYFGRTEQMLANLLRDEATMPVVARLFAGFHAFLGAAQEALLAGRRLRGSARRRTAAALGHAVAFPTWRSLVREQGLEDREAVELMCRLVGEAASPRPR